MTLLLLLSETENGPANVRLVATAPDGPLEVGDMVSRTVEWRRVDTNELVDPGTITAQARDPYGTTTTITPTRIGTGTYQVAVLADMDGTWTYHVLGSTPFPGALERRFTVQPTAFAA